MIVIVERSPLDALYDGLPVVVVDDLAAITDRKLRRWAVAFDGATPRSTSAAAPSA